MIHIAINIIRVAERVIHHRFASESRIQARQDKIGRPGEATKTVGKKTGQVRHGKIIRNRK